MAMELVRNLPYNHPYRWDGTLFGGPKLWRPTELSTALWLDAEDTSTITLNGSTVSQWNDKSGNGRNAIQATATNQPTYVSSSLNNKPAISFDGVDDYLVSNAASYTVGTAFIVYKVNVFGSNRQFYSSRTSPNATLAAASDISFGFGAANTGTNVGNYATNSAYAALDGTQVNTTNFNNYLVGVPASTNWAISTNEPNSATAALSGTKCFVLGCDIFAITRAINGNIAEFVICSGVPDSTVRQKLEGYLAWKWGLEANLPVGHPYKTLPPTV